MLSGITHRCKLLAQIVTGAIQLTHHAIKLGKLCFVARDGIVDAVADGQILFGQFFQRGVNIVLGNVNNAVVGQVTFYFGSDFGGNTGFFTITNQQLTSRCGVIFQRFFQLSVVNFQLA